MTIFAPDMGQLQLHGPGYDNVGPDFSDPVHGANAGFLTYTIDQNYFPRYESQREIEKGRGGEIKR